MIGVNTALNPNTINKLQILDPTTLPIATLALPPLIKHEIESDTETASSGQLVPIATTVKPMISGEIFAFFAKATDPSTKISQNFTKHNTQTT